MKKNKKKISLESKEKIAKKLKKLVCEKINVPRSTSDFLSGTLQII